MQIVQTRSSFNQSMLTMLSVRMTRFQRKSLSTQPVVLIVQTIPSGILDRMGPLEI